MGARVLAFGGAVFSEDRSERFLLWRPTGAPGGKVCTFVMLNPSNANEHDDDPTVRRCIGYARSWGYSTLKIVNLWSYVTSKPEVLAKRIEEGNLGDQMENVARVRGECAGAFVVCAWGRHGSMYNRSAFVSSLLETDNVRLHVLGLCANGEPKHPVRLAKALEPQPWRHKRCDSRCNR